jgi:hypothetical protein
VFSAAGGTHDDWAEYDRVMAAERRVAVLIEPARLTSSPEACARQMPTRSGWSWASARRSRAPIAASIRRETDGTVVSSVANS